MDQFDIIGETLQVDQRKTDRGLAAFQWYVMAEDIYTQKFRGLCHTQIGAPPIAGTCSGGHSQQML